MELADLRYFVSAVDTSKLLSAAKALNVDVSTVSRRISVLENELGVTLLERDHAGVRLTSGGEVVAKLARRILANVEEIKHAASHIARGDTGILRLGLGNPRLLKLQHRTFWAHPPSRRDCSRTTSNRNCQL